MNLSTERVRQLLKPSKVIVSRMLDGRVPWKAMPEDIESKRQHWPTAKPSPIDCCDAPLARIEPRAPGPYESLPEVILIGVDVYRCDNCLTEVTIIPQQQDLDKVLGRRVLLKAASMSGRELRFLRVASHLTLEALSKLLDVNRGTLIDWEASETLRYHDDLAARFVIALILSAETDLRLILEILATICVGKEALKPVRAEWWDSERRWTVESADRDQALQSLRVDN
jgi:hypothetical protein